MQVGVVGINHKLAEVHLREIIAKACQKHFAIGNPLSHQESYVLLLTCNRAEIYFSSDELAETHQKILELLREEVEEDFEQKCYSFFGKDCFYHLAKVTSGLDSAILAESEIQGQVKTSYEQGQNLRTLSSELHFLFQKCLKIGKEVRTSCFITKSLPDLEHAILHSAYQFFKQISLPSPLFIGLSEINLKIAAFLRQQGISKLTFCSRRANSCDLDVDFIAWDTLQSRWRDFNWIISASKSPSYVITNQSLITETEPKLLIDLAVPRNIDPNLQMPSDWQLLNIDRLKEQLVVRKAALEDEIKEAEALIEAAVERLFSAYLLRDRKKITFTI
jgi:glutamyl-tRNA reductase